MGYLEDVKKKYGTQRGDYFADAIRKQIISFCKQNEEFCQCVAQSDGKNLDGCVAHIKKNQKNNNCISDLEAYQLMAGYFFPGATVECNMTIYLCEAEKENAENVINLDFSSLI